MLKALISTFVLSSAVVAVAQTAESLLPPIAAEQIQYRHWPEQFVQWLGTEVPYSMIELYVDPTAKDGPLYDAVLTDRATGKRIHYSNQQAMVEIDKRQGSDAYLVQMQLDRPPSAATGATYLLRFTDHAGQPVIWQFIQGSDITERGGGMSPAGTEPPVLVYRQRSAVAGEGTALKIGNAVSAAELWSEISHPPFFVAYRGALTQDVNIAVFTGLPQQWTVVSGPKALAVGAEWKLKAADGLGAALHVDSLSGNLATITEQDDHLPGRTITLEATWANGTWAVNKMRYAPAGADAGAGLSVLFTPGVTASDAAPAKFDVVVGRKTKIATGTVHSDTKQAVVSWEFKDPDWLRGKSASVGSEAVAVTGQQATLAK